MPANLAGRVEMDDAALQNAAMIGTGEHSRRAGMSAECSKLGTSVVCPTRCGRIDGTVAVRARISCTHEASGTTGTALDYASGVAGSKRVAV